MSFVDLSRYLGEQLQSPLLKQDKQLRLWCLIAKGYLNLYSRLQHWCGNRPSVRGSTCCCLTYCR